MPHARPLSLRAAQCAMELQEKLNRYRTGRTERIDTKVANSNQTELSSGGSILSIKISLGYGRITAFHVGGERNRFEFFMAGAPLVQVKICLIALSSLRPSLSNTNAISFQQILPVKVTLAEHQAKPGDIILSNESWKMVMENCQGTVLSSGDVKLTAINKPIPVRPQSPLKLKPEIEASREFGCQFCFIPFCPSRSSLAVALSHPRGLILSTQHDSLELHTCSYPCKNG